MKTNIFIDILSSIPYLANLLFLSYGPKCCWLIKLQNSLKRIISRKKSVMKFVFGMQITIETSFRYFCNIPRKTCGIQLISFLQINMKVFYKLIVLLWVCIARYAQNSQNNKFVIF